MVAASNDATTHDASTGFHDIKPLARFDASANPLPYFVAAALVLLALLGTGLMLKRRKRPALPPPICPLTLAKSQLETLQTKQWHSEAEFRELCTASSLAFRSGIESLLSIPAPEMTVSELQQALPKALTTSEDNKSRKAQRVSLEQKINATLRWYERNTYGLGADIANEHSIQQANARALQCLDELELCISERVEAEDSADPKLGAAASPRTRGGSTHAL